MQLVIAVVLACSVALGAQQAEAPTLSDAQALTLTLFELQAENLRLRLALVERERAALLVSLARSGYQLSRQSDGTWRYLETPR